MHGVGDLAPALDLSLSVDAGRVLVALSLLRDLRGFGDDQPSRGALAVILRGEITRNEVRASAVARQGRHDNTIGEGQRAESIGLKQRLVGHSSPMLSPPQRVSITEMVSLMLRRPCGTARRDAGCHSSEAWPGARPQAHPTDRRREAAESSPVRDGQSRPAPHQSDRPPPSHWRAC